MSDTGGESLFSRWSGRGRIVLTFVVLFLAWQGLVEIFKPAPYILPAPSEIIAKLILQRGIILDHAMATTQAILLGYACAILIAIPLALAISFSRFLQTTVYPVVLAFQTIPKVAIAPIFIIWFGFGMTPKLLIVFMISFFPILVNSIQGFLSINRDVMDFAISTGASRWKLFRMIRLPAALPEIFVGLRIGAILAPTAAVIGEFVASDKGIGYLLLRFNGDLETASSFATICALSIIGLILYYSVEAVERWVLPWRKLIQAEDVRAGAI